MGKRISKGRNLDFISFFPLQFIPQTFLLYNACHQPERRASFRPQLSNKFFHKEQKRVKFPFNNTADRRKARSCCLHNCLVSVEMNKCSISTKHLVWIEAETMRSMFCRKGQPVPQSCTESNNLRRTGLG